MKKTIVLVFCFQALAGFELEKQLSIAGKNRIEIQQAMDNVLPDSHIGMEWLISHMPEEDLKTLSSEFLINNCELAYESRKSFPWGMDVPEEIFFDAVLPYASLNEKRDDWRRDFRNKFEPIVINAKSSYEAAVLLNHQIYDKLGVIYSTDRPKADQSPFESINAGMASCTGLSILLIAACRSVGVPARFAGTPLWHNNSGNHSWVEIWDDGWHFTGAAEPTGNILNETWFQGLASNAKKGDEQYGIYAVTWNNSEIFFPMNWLPGVKTYRAIDITDRYKIKDDKNGELVPIRIRSLDASGIRKSVKVTIISENDFLYEGTTKDKYCDANDHLTFMIPKGKTITVKSLNDIQKIDVVDKEKIIDLRADQISK